MNLKFRQSLISLLALLTVAVNLPTLSVFADSHSLEDCRQQFGDELLEQFCAQAGDRNELMQNGTLSGVYTDAAATLHIAVTNESDRAAYEKWFSADTLTSLAAEHLTDTRCSHTTEELTEAAIVFERATVSLAKLHTMQDALNGHLTELGIYQTSVLEDKNCLEIRTEDTDHRAGIVNWLSQNIEDFDERSVQILVQPNTAELEKSVVWLENPWYAAALIGGAVVFITVVVGIFLLLRRKKAK